jgi:excisionase family DNA binding protein
MTTDTQAGALLLRLREAATLLAVSERQVWTLIRAGQLPAIHPIGMRAIRIARRDVEALVERWRAQSPHRP